MAAYLTILATFLASGPSEPREAGFTYYTSRPLIELQACVTRQLAHRGTPLAIPAEGGVDIDLSEPTPLGQIANEARYSLRIREFGDRRQLSATYRHPYSMKAALMITKNVGKRCFPEVLPK